MSNLDSGTKTFSDLVSDRVFHIPNYQRYYSWEEKQLEDLWTDILVLEKGKKHYFGTVILQETGNFDETEGSFPKKYEIFNIIDGQQRFTAVAILLKVLNNKMKKVSEGDVEILERIKEIEKKYHKDNNVYKLKLLDDDALFFKKHIIDDEKEPREEITPSQRRLWRAKKFYEEKFKELYDKSDTIEDFVLKCNQIKNKIEDLEVMTYPINKDEEERATLIFESVNDRGRNLSDLDKTKSFLMYMVYLSTSEDKKDLSLNLDYVKNSFSNIYRHLQKIKDNKYGRNISEDDIQRFHYISFHNWKNKEEYQNLLDNLKNNIRKTYRNKKKAYCERCIEDIKNYVKDLEISFQNLKEILYYDEDADIKELLLRFHMLRNEANFYPLLISIWTRFKDKKVDLLKILGAIEIFCFRVYSVGNHPQYTGRTKLFRLARENHYREISSDKWKREMLKIVGQYEDDETFKEHTLKSSKFYHQVKSRGVKYLLYFYERYLGKKEKEDIPINLVPIMSKNYSVEHIWPQNPEKLSIKDKESYEKYKDRLGNLTLATAEWNSKFGNKNFDEKKKLYGKSSLRVQRDLTKYDSWDDKNIEIREKLITKFIIGFWDIE